MSKHVRLSTLAFGVTLFAVVSSASSVMADPKEEALLPIERKISSFTIRVTNTGYAHFASLEKAPIGSLPAKIIAIDGRNSKDIWMLTDNGVVLQDDGKDIKFRQAKPCGWGEYSREFNGVGTALFNIVVDENEVHVVGQSRSPTMRYGREIRATLARNGKWTCSEKSLVPDHMHSAGALTWRAAYAMEGDACRIGSLAGHCTSGPRFAPTHIDPPRDSVDMGIENIAMWMHGPDDGWVVTLNEEFHGNLYRFNGVTWTKQTNIDEEDVRVNSIWGDEQHHLWMTAGDRSSTVIFRYDGKNLTSIPTPASFAASMMRGHSSRDIWFSGAGGAIYQWDGSRLRQGKLPDEVSAMWVSSDDVAYFVLPDAIAFAAPAVEKH
jgi:hypothetical protein